jgi:transcriptional regulator with XRE-family HTH domain
MSYGYSQGLVLANKKASVKLPGVALGRACIKSGISVNVVAEYFGVSRMTIYNWFKGDSSPLPSILPKVLGYTRHIKYNRI